VLEGKFPALSGKMIEVEADTLCLHGDQPGAVAFAKALRKAFSEKGINIVAP
jgi:5-oxoprolinase (ATP-hydrolysing) subunit A